MLSLLALSAVLATNAPAYFVPADDDQVLQRVPTIADPRVRHMESLRALHERRPQDLEAALALARAYLDYGRGTGDARYLGRAEAVIEPWLRLATPPLDVSLVHATILQSRHDFDAARAQLEALLQRDPGNDQAWLTLASVQLVQGEPEAARRSCARLIGGPDALAALACLAAVNMVNGRAADAYESLARIVGRAPPAAPQVRAWTEGLLADAARSLGHDALAERHFQAGLQAAPGDNFLLADYADLLLDLGRNGEALALVKDYSASDTSFLRQVLAEQRLGLPQAQADAAQMAARFADEARRGSRLYLREQARFVLEVERDPARALALAQDNWRSQRAPEDARLLLAAALAADQPAVAAPAVALVERTHLEDPRVRELLRRLRRAQDGAP
ncbi:MAG: tetratricopeptide repeat protein [Nevskia sp.]|nr:tetratricopeptide repeat protein [Nevskia sp.]